MRFIKIIITESENVWRALSHLGTYVMEGEGDGELLLTEMTAHIANEKVTRLQFRLEYHRYV